MPVMTVNGDDFGLNERNSKAIAAAFARGCITDTTMLANGAWFEEAVALARQQGFLDKIGIHLNLTEGVPLTDAVRRCPRFVTDGRFNKAYDRAEPLTAAEEAAVYAELTAQAERLRQAGIAVTHADSHHHMHTWAFTAPVALRVCREQGIRAVRAHRNLGQFAIAGEAYNRGLAAQGFAATRYFAYAADIAGGSIPDSTEVMVHPDYDANGVLIDRRGRENGVPTGAPLPDFRADPNIQFKSFAEVASVLPLAANGTAYTQGGTHNADN